MDNHGRIVRRGTGGFLNPPTHPEHEWGVETDLRRKPENRGSMSLGQAAKSTWLDEATRNAARARLIAWSVSRPALDDPRIQDWILQVLGYFHDCYKGEGPECWHADKLRILPPQVPNGWGEYPPPPPPVDEHAGVHYIRKFYPEFTPTGKQFARAYWGKKQA